MALGDNFSRCYNLESHLPTEPVYIERLDYKAALQDDAKHHSMQRNHEKRLEKSCMPGGRLIS